eukprot:TRINITY_DN17660_c0_g1_i1.p1 TRINITY_DN17660_c0_g1~~TRINITY_DN17660_c0_g1_i1.p1  ORF type:complete len:253 (+),score=25.46 TRINITY_DN17660_c0_g1_i1:77-760(+)
MLVGWASLASAVLTRAIVPARSEDSLDPSEVVCLTKGAGISYPSLFSSTDRLIRSRMLGFDKENITAYQMGSADDIKVRVYVHGEEKVNGIDDAKTYKSVFSEILSSFIKRKVWGIHTMNPIFHRALETDADGEWLSFSSHADFYMEECYKADIQCQDSYEKCVQNCKRSWKSSGYSRCNWRRLSELRRTSSDMSDISNWEIFDYRVHVMNTSEDFGSTSDECDGLC